MTIEHCIQPVNVGLLPQSSSYSLFLKWLKQYVIVTTTKITARGCSSTLIISLNLIISDLLRTENYN